MRTADTPWTLFSIVVGYHSLNYSIHSVALVDICTRLDAGPIRDYICCPLRIKFRLTRRLSEPIGVAEGAGRTASSFALGQER